jgi:hypothetical protein
MVAKGREFSDAQKRVNDCLEEGFNIGNIGELDCSEQDLKNSLSEFSKICEDFRDGFGEMLNTVEEVKKNMIKFDEDQVKKKYKETKKIFGKASEKYYAQMQSGLQIGEGKAEAKKKNAADDIKRN